MCVNSFQNTPGGRNYDRIYYLVLERRPRVFPVWTLDDDIIYVAQYASLLQGACVWRHTHFVYVTRKAHVWKPFRGPRSAGFMRLGNTYYLMRPLIAAASQSLIRPQTSMLLHAVEKQTIILLLLLLCAYTTSYDVLFTLL